jgi:hypothetical protein
VPKHEIGKAMALVARFEARFRAEGKQRKGRESLPRAKAGNQAIRQLKEPARQVRGNRKGGEVDLRSRCEVDCCQPILVHSNPLISSIILAQLSSAVPVNALFLLRLVLKSISSHYCL